MMWRARKVLPIPRVIEQCLANGRNVASVARSLSENLTNEPTETASTVAVNHFATRGFVLNTAACEESNEPIGPLVVVDAWRESRGRPYADLGGHRAENATNEANSLRRSNIQSDRHGRTFVPVREGAYCSLIPGAGISAGEAHYKRGQDAPYTWVLIRSKTAVAATRRPTIQRLR